MYWECGSETRCWSLNKGNLASSVILFAWLKFNLTPTGLLPLMISDRDRYAWWKNTVRKKLTHGISPEFLLLSGLASTILQTYFLVEMYIVVWFLELTSI